MPDRPKQNAASRWLDEIERYQRAAQYWKKQAKRLTDRYRLQKNIIETGNLLGSGSKPVFNILWSNVQTMKPSMFSKVPTVVAERRHKDRDLIGRLSAECIERGANEEIEENNLKDAMDDSVLDLLITGRGTPWVRFEADEVPDKDRVANERTMVDYVHWDDFAHSLERKWADVQRRGWVARRVALTRKEGEQRFGEIFGKVELTLTTRTEETREESKRSGTDDAGKYAEVWEVWDRPSGKRIFVSPGHREGPLEEKDDPYRLTKFFPCPKPAYGTLTNDDLFPTPDHMQVEALAHELDEQTTRIRSLVEDLRVAGIYDASAEGLGRLLDPGNRQKMIAVTNIAALTGKSAGAGGGLNGVMQFFPLEAVVQALTGLYGAREQTKQTLYEISGISDIVRGEVDPREKASQSRIKAQFASQRLDQRRREVERVARDVVRIMVELMVELYPSEKLREQCGFDFLNELEGREDIERDMVWERVMALFRDDKLRKYRIDVETDSTVELDAGQTQQSRTEFLQAAGNFMQHALPIAQVAPQLGDVMGEMLLYTIRSYRAGRTLEGRFEEAIQNMKQAREQAAQQPQRQDPEAEARAQESQAKAQAMQQKAQIEGAKGQAEIQRMQQRTQIEGAKGQLELQSLQQRGTIEAQKGGLELDQSEQALEQQIQEGEYKLEMLRAQLEMKRQGGEQVQ